ncbi:MAG: NAD(P)/FAD-dependent oxidoreductase [Anaerolineae bacterium]
MYDAIIAGASFAGLAVANQLRSHRVLLIDRKPIGAGQTSACGTILQVLQHWDLTETVLQTHDSLVLHTARRAIEFPSSYPWCTFDYRRLCETLFERSGADFLQAAVQDTDGKQVRTSRGDFRARCVVDASGWRAVLASSVVPGFVQAASMNFGIETIRPLPDDARLDPSGLHFWYAPVIIQGGVGWVFPRGATASVGIGSYRGVTHLRSPLDRFAERFDLQPDGLHGTYFPHSLRAPTAGRVFVIGDAAGMCLGLTGEGIRPALFFGEACGRIVRRVLGGQLTLEAGLAEYATFVRARQHFFQILSTAQAILIRLPPPWIDRIALLVHHDRVRPWVLDVYWSLTREWDTIGNHPA